MNGRRFHCRIFVQAVLCLLNLKELSPMYPYLSVRFSFFFYCFKSLIVLELDLLCSKDYTSPEEQELYS